MKQSCWSSGGFSLEIPFVLMVLDEVCWSAGRTDLEIELDKAKSQSCHTMHYFLYSYILIRIVTLTGICILCLSDNVLYLPRATTTPKFWAVFTLPSLLTYVLFWYILHVYTLLCAFKPFSFQWYLLHISTMHSYGGNPSWSGYCLFIGRAVCLSKLCGYIGHITSGPVPH